MTQEIIGLLKPKKSTEPNIEMNMIPASSTWKNKLSFRFIKCHPYWAGSLVTVIILFHVYHKNDIAKFKTNAKQFISQIFTSEAEYNNSAEPIKSSTETPNIPNRLEKDHYDPVWLDSESSIQNITMNPPN